MEESQFMNDRVTDLNMIPTYDLIKELTARCAPACFIGTRYDGDGDERNWKSFEWYHGDPHTCRGLLKELDSKIEKQIRINDLKELDS